MNFDQTSIELNSIKTVFLYIQQIDVTAMEKPERTQIHQMLKEVFKTIGSSTTDQDDKKFIKFFKQSKRSNSIVTHSPVR